MAVKMNREQRTGLGLVISILFIDELLYSLIIPIIPFFTGELHISSTMTGFLFSSYAVASLIATPFFGKLTDQVGRRIPILIGLVLLAVSTFLFAFSHSIGLLIISRMTQGIAAGAAWTAALAYLVDLFPPKTRGKAMGFAFTGISTGSLLGAPIGGLIFELGGYEWPFLSAAGFAVLVIILVLLFLPKISIQQQTEKTGMLALLRQPPVLFIGLIILLAATTLCLLDPVLPILLSGTFHLSSGMIGLAFGIMTLAYGLMSPISGSFADRYHPRRVLLISLTGLAVALVCMALSPTIWLVISTMVFAGLCMGSSLSPAMSYLGDVIDNSGKSSYGAAYALSNMIFMVGMIAGPAIGGTLVDEWSVTAVLTLLGFVIFLFVILMLGMIKRRKDQTIKKNLDQHQTGGR